MNTRIPPTRRIKTSSLMGMTLNVSQAVRFLGRNTSLAPDRVNNRRLLSLMEASVILSSARRRGTPRTGPSLALVRSVLFLNLPRIRRTWMEV